MKEFGFMKRIGERRSSERREGFEKHQRKKRNYKWRGFLKILICIETVKFIIDFVVPIKEYQLPKRPLTMFRVPFYR